MRWLFVAALLVGCTKNDSNGGNGATSPPPTNATTTDTTTTPPTTTEPPGPSPLVLVGRLPDPDTRDAAILGLRQDGNWAVLSTESFQAFAVSPDRSVVVFNGPHPDDASITVPLLQPMVDGEAPVPLSDAELWMNEARFSPDGSHIAVIGGSGPTDDHQLWLLSVDDETSTLAFQSAQGQSIWDYEWRDDGQWLKFQHLDEVQVASLDGVVRLVGYDADANYLWQPGGSHMLLENANVLQMYDPGTNSFVWEMDPGLDGLAGFGWSADGLTRWWMLGGFSSYQLYVSTDDVNDAGAPVDDMAWNRTPIWAPDGSRAVYWAEANTVTEVSWDGVVTDIPVPLAYLHLELSTWSETGAYVAFPADEVLFGTTELYVMDGVDVLPVTSGGYDPVFPPSWTWIGDDGIAIDQGGQVTWFSPDGAAAPAEVDLANAALAEFAGGLTCDVSVAWLGVVQTSPAITVAVLDTPDCPGAPSHTCTLFEGGVGYCVEGQSSGGLYALDDGEFPLVLEAAD